MSTHAVDQHPFTGPASYIVSIVGMIAAWNWESILYLMLAVATFGINWYYKHKSHLRDEEKHKENTLDG